MPDDTSIWKVIPEDNPRSVWKPIPEDAHVGQYAGSLPSGGTGSDFWDSLLSRVTSKSPLNPGNWRQMLSDAVSSPFSQEHFDKAQELVKTGDEKGLGAFLKSSADLPEGDGHMAGDIAGHLVNAGLMIGAAKAAGYIPRAFDANPAKDLINAYGIKDPRAPERLMTGVSDIAHDSGAKITSNEHLAKTSPDYAIKPAYDENRDAWNDWRQAAGNRTILPNSIMRAASDSLKDFADPAVKAKILDDLHDKLIQSPLTASRLEEINSQINGELKSSGFYSRDEAARSAARQAGAVSGRSQSFLEAVGQKARDELYTMMDPANAGAGPREVQHRYGNMKMITDPATEDRSAIYAETSGTPFGKTVDSLKNTAVAVGKAAVGGHFAGPAGTLYAASDIPNILDAFRGKTDPVIARAFRNAPEYKPLPRPVQPTPATPNVTASYAGMGSQNPPPTTAMPPQITQPISALSSAQLQYLRQVQKANGKITLRDMMRAKDIE